MAIIIIFLRLQKTNIIKVDVKCILRWLINRAKCIVYNCRSRHGFTYKTMWSRLTLFHRFGHLKLINTGFIRNEPINRSGFPHDSRPYRSNTHIVGRVFLKNTCQCIGAFFITAFVFHDTTIGVEETKCTNFFYCRAMLGAAIFVGAGLQNLLLFGGCQPCVPEIGATYGGGTRLIFLWDIVHEFHYHFQLVEEGCITRHIFQFGDRVRNIDIYHVDNFTVWFFTLNFLRLQQFDPCTNNPPVEFCAWPSHLTFHTHWCEGIAFYGYMCATYCNRNVEHGIDEWLEYVIGVAINDESLLTVMANHECTITYSVT